MSTSKSKYVIPGEIIFGKGDIELNVGKNIIKIKVTNTGDRPIQVGSHFHFAETNSALEFDIAAAEEQRLNIPAGLSVRFEPGETNADVPDKQRHKIQHYFTLSSACTTISSRHGLFSLNKSSQSRKYRKNVIRIRICNTLHP